MSKDNVPPPLIKRTSPLSVIVMDDDYGSLKWYSKLLMRDPRTTVCHEAHSPSGLVKSLVEGQNPDVIVLDAEYMPADLPLDTLIMDLKALSPGTDIVCLSQYGNPISTRASTKAGALGFLIKEELQFGLATAVTLANQDWFVMTPAARRISDDFEIKSMKRTCAVLHWELPAGLKPALHESFVLRVICGMRAPLAAQEIYKATQTVEKYMNISYHTLHSRGVNRAGLEDIIWENLSPEDQAFLLYCQPHIKVVQRFEAAALNLNQREGSTYAKGCSRPYC